MKLEQATRALLAHWDTPAWKYLKPTGDLMADLREALDHSGEATDMAGCSYCNNPLFAGRKCNNCGREADQAEHEPFDMDDHPPHRLCECRKCMEYFTPLPDCDAFAASGKPIADQTNTQLMEGYRIGLAEMREKCAKVCDDLSNPFGNASLMAEQCAAAIRAINFEGDAGFRPLSEMIAEHKQDPKKAAAIEKAKMRKAKQEPVSLHKVVEEHIADLRACVPTLRQYPEMASMTREVIKAANELEAALKSEQAEQEPVGYVDEALRIKWLINYDAVSKLTGHKLYAAQQPVTTPDVCGEVCARAKLCYGCNKDLEEANAKYAEQAEGVIVKTCPDGYGTITTEQAEQEQYPTYGFCPICGSRGISRERRIDGNDTCANGHSYASNLALHIAPEKQAEQECKDCTRSHPHEEMSKCCELRTEIARLRHSLRVKELAEQAKCKECGAKQAQIDSLMLEYCPDEMTPEQMLEWGNNQRPAEQAEQEPVAWMWKPSKPFPQYTVITDNKENLEAAKEQGVEITPLYAAPVRTKDLTDDELLNELKMLDASTARLPIGFKLFARAVIAADREKNK